jgi:transposase
VARLKFVVDIGINRVPPMHDELVEAQGYPLPAAPLSPDENKIGTGWKYTESNPLSPENSSAP